MNKTKITYDEFCHKYGIDPNKLPDVSSFPENDRKYYLALFKWDNIRKCLNGTDKICPADARQYKYEPYAIVKEDQNHPSGFGFDRTGYGGTVTGTLVGARHRFIRIEDAMYAINNFPDIYLDIVIEY